MQKFWQARNPESEIRSSISALAASCALRGMRLQPLTVAVCAQRGMSGADDVMQALQPSLSGLKSPWTIKDMDLAVDRLVQARDRAESITVFSDYDVDGTCGGALLGNILRALGFQVRNTQPDRFKDGYGLSVRGVDDAAAANSSLLITVDCGITSFDAIDRAKVIAMDVIVVDHHQIDPMRGIPAALAVIDPHRVDCTSGLKELCGCGLAFYLAMALRSKARDLGWFANGAIAEPNLRQYLDLVVLATAADQVPMVGDNRILVRHGMAVLKHSARPGMLALLEAAGVTKREITPSHLGFVLGPRINASGRLANASMAMELLSTQDVARARELAQSIEALNRERMQLQNDIWDLVKARVSERIERGMFQHAIVVGDPSWHEGVVGIVASRVVETFGKPAVVIGNGKGSVRSTRGIDVLQALRDSSAWLKGFGGHRFAAGLSLEMENLEAFSNAFDASVGALLQAGGGRSRETLWIDALAMPGDLDWATYAELGELGPWGPSYPEPVIAVESRALSFRAMKDRHLKINLEGGLEAVWFHTPEPPQILGKRWTESKQPLWWVGVPEVNQFMGRSTRVLRLKDVGTTMSPELLSSFQLSPSEYRPIEAARV